MDVRSVADSSRTRGRVYAAYEGIFILSSIIGVRIVDGKKPDRYELIGSLVAVVGALIIFYAPR